DVEQFPDVSRQARQVARLPRRTVDGPRQPAVVIDRAIAEHLEILRLVALRRLRIVEGVEHTDAFDRRLHHAIDALGLRQTGGFQDRRRNVDHVLALAAQSAFFLDALLPVYASAVNGTA